MTIPTTDEYLNLNTATFTKNGSIVVADDQHGTDNTFIWDGINDWLSSLEIPFTNGSGTSHTFSLWLKYDDTAADRFIICQHSGGSDRTFLLAVNGSGRLDCVFFSSSANFLRSRIAAGQNDWDDFNWRHILCTTNGSVVDIYLDGVEVASYQTDSEVGGTGFAGFPVSPETLSIGASNAGTLFYKDTLSRPKFWEGTYHTATPALQEFNAEVAAIGGGRTPGTKEFTRYLDRYFDRNYRT